MKVIAIDNAKKTHEASKENYLRGEKMTIQEFILDDLANPRALALNSKGLFRVIELNHFAEGDSLSRH